MTVEIKSGRDARALWYVAPGRAELRPASVHRSAGEARVRMLWSGLSRGTERLVMSGRVPEAEYDRMRAPLQEGAFPFPVKYGYCAVGIVDVADEAALVGRTVFCLHPHQSAFAAPVDLLTVLPDGLPPRRATLAANMETALNALWDSGAGPGDRIAVVGAGLVGLLVAYLAARLPGADVTVVDVDASRAPLAERFGASFSTPERFGAPGDADVVFHASASPGGLAVALAAAGLEARIVELSWYGEGAVPVALGGAFHSRRLQLVSSQVGQVAPSRRPRWTYARRLGKALELLADPRLDDLITGDVAFADLPDELPTLLAPAARGLATVVRYGEDDA